MGTTVLSTEVIEATEPLIGRLTRDLKAAAVLMTRDEARFLVDAYYQIQEHRIAMAAQSRTLTKNQEPNILLDFISTQQELLEARIKQALENYARKQPAGEWALGVCGIGPVLSAGLLAYLDPDKFTYVGSVMRFAGWDPTMTWEKGQKRPYAAGLKTLFYKIGESFVKVQNNDKDYYGKVYRKWKDEYIHRDELGAHATAAEAKLNKFKIGKDTEAYKAYSQGKLPPAHLHARARRKAVTLFIAHFCQVLYETHHNKPFPRPYVFEYAPIGEKTPHDERSLITPPNYSPLKR